LELHVSILHAVGYLQPFERESPQRYVTQFEVVVGLLVDVVGCAITLELYRLQVSLHNISLLIKLLLPRLQHYLIDLALDVKLLDLRLGVILLPQLRRVERLPSLVESFDHLCVRDHPREDTVHLERTLTATLFVHNNENLYSIGTSFRVFGGAGPDTGTR
jgi:hypothetical protein